MKVGKVISFLPLGGGGLGSGGAELQRASVGEVGEGVFAGQAPLRYRHGKKNKVDTKPLLLVRVAVQLLAALSG